MNSGSNERHINFEKCGRNIENMSMTKGNFEKIVGENFQ